MKMSDVRVGMRLESTLTCSPSTRFVTVTEITPLGFKYEIDHEISLIPRWGMTMAKDGHEHYGFNGEALYEHMRRARELLPSPQEKSE